MASVFLRLVLAILFGGIIGLERERKRRAAGFRTYILVCLGAALAMLLGQYYAWMLAGTELTVDVARMGAQVINGIGFLGAGTVLITGKQQVKGLTTAAGLWASACVGLAIGAGFYACVFFAFLLIVLVVRILPTIEGTIVEYSRNMNFYLEFDEMENVGQLINHIKAKQIQIYEVEVSRGEDGRSPSAVFVVHLNERRSHSELLLDLSEVDCIRSIEEL